MTINQIIDLALSFPEVMEAPHFVKTSFRVRKKIFATLNKEKMNLVVKLPILDQSVFCDMMSEIVQPVAGGWGKKGWTSVDFETIPHEGLKDLLTTAYKEVAPASLSSNL